MTNLKTTKRALLSSVIALLVCFTMLLGTTFAWFTDSVISSSNIIKTGKLDISLEHADAPLEATNEGWTVVGASTAQQAPIFNYETLEPGYTIVKYIKIENEGTLDLKYILNIVPNAAAEEVNLADVIDVYMFEGAVSVKREDLTPGDAAYAGTLSELMNKKGGVVNGNLYAEDATETENEKPSYHIYTLALKMNQDAGNEYMDKTVAGGFSIQLLATQLASESDSIDDQYDKDAKLPSIWDGTYPTERPESFVVDTENHTITLNDANAFFYLNAFFSGSEKASEFPDSEYWGYEIILNTDIDMQNQNFTPVLLGREWMNKNYYEPFTDASFETWGDRQRAFGGITAYGEYSKFNGNGHTIKNVNLNSKANKLGLFNTVLSVCDLNLENVTIVAANETYDAGISVGALAGYYTTTIDRNAAPAGIENVTVKNVNISGNGKYVGGLIGYNGIDIKNCKLENVTLSGTNSVGGIIGFQDAGSCTVSGCELTNVKLTCTRADRVGYLAGRTNLINNTNMAVKDCVITNVTVTDASEIKAVGTDHGTVPTYNNVTVK